MSDDLASRAGDVRSGEVPTIALLSALAGGAYFGDLAAAIDDVARRQGARVLAVQTAHSWAIGPKLPAPYAPVGIAHIDGLIIVSDALSQDGIRQVAANGKPVVTISVLNPLPRYPAIMPDNCGGTLDAVRHLLDHGHRRIAFVGWMGQEDVRERYEAYRCALLERGIAPDPHLVFAAPDMLESGGEVAARAMLELLMPCSAVMVSTDANAIGLMRTLQDAGHRVPQDVAVVAFDDIDTAQQAEPPLSTVRVNLSDLGAAAAECLLATLAGKPVPEGVVTVPVALVRRQSCGCLDEARSSTQPCATCVDCARQDWPGVFTTRLARALVWPLEPDAGVTDERLWPGIDVVVAALSAALAGDPKPSRAGLENAWRAACQHTSSAETLDLLLEMLACAGRHRSQVTGCPDPAGSDRLAAFVSDARLSILRSMRYTAVRARRAEATALERSQQVSMQLVRSSGGSAASLEWARFTNLRHCCLALWNDDEAGESRTLVVRGVFHLHADRGPSLGTRLDLADFPPAEFLDECAESGVPQTVYVLPLATDEREWGYLAAVTAAERQFHEGHDALRLWMAELVAALAREELEHTAEQQGKMLHDHQRRELERSRATAARLEELNQQLAAADRLKTKLLEQSEAQAAAAEDLAQLRSGLVATASHELRTPLTAIVGYAELLKAHWDRLDDAARLDRIDRIAAAANRQVRLVEDLLLLSRMEMGGFMPQIETTSLGALVERAADEVRTSYRGQRISLCGPEDLRVRIDVGRTMQILVNLIDNAAKYSPEGASIDVSWIPDGDRVVVRVRDHGVGMPAEGRDHLFTRFGRVPGSSARPGHTGTGLGLFLGHGFAQAMGAALDLESTGPQGSVFRLTLPMA